MREVEALTKQNVTKMELPTIEDIQKYRESKVVENMKIWLGRGRFKREARNGPAVNRGRL